MSTEAEHRLPRSVVPRRYDLTMEPDLDALTFRGSARIEVDVVERVSTVVLNAIDLDIEVADLVDAEGRVLASATVAYDTVMERATLAFGQVLTVGTQWLDVRFAGVLNDRLHGFYHATYDDADGNPQLIATTQFEATDARRAFPCWDEPDLKAVFGVTLIVPGDMTAVSCASVVADDDLGDGRRRVRFADTMLMSTYLLAFIVGDLEATDPVTVDGTPLRVLAVPEKRHLTSFALEAGAHALRYFAEYYGIDYPGDKLDLIAIPDFSAGAMENLGAVTFRESALLIDPGQATQAELERVVAVIAHEIAHMWFGDLVTMRWWNGTWLKEAFATFMEMKCTDAFRPEWNTWVAFGPTRDSAMEIDALASTRSIEFPVHSPADANAMFDTITYEKGSAVLRMFEQYLGEDTFRRGIGQYLAKHAYGNTDTTDLWDALENVSGEPIRSIAHSWIYEGGFPQVLVDSTDRGVRLTSSRFRYVGDGGGDWIVPVRYRSDGHEGRTLVDGSVVIDAAEAVVVNAGGSGFYRTRYAPDLFGELASQISGLPAAERFALVADTWAGVLAGDRTAADYLDLVASIGAETEPAVWVSVIDGLSELDRIVSSDDRAHLQRFTQIVLAGTVDRLGWHPGNDDTDLTRRLRGIALRAMGTLGDDRAVQREAVAVLDQWTGDPESVDGDVASAALHIAADAGDRSDFEQFVAAYRRAVSPQDRVRLLRAAAQVPDIDGAQELLEMVIDGRIRRQDAYWVVARLIGHRDTGVAVWRTVKSRWREILDAMPPQNARLMLNQLHHRSEPEVAADIDAWVSAHPIEGSEQLVAQQLERLAVRVALRSRESDALAEALRSRTS